MNVDIYIPKVFEDLLKPARYHVYHGGRGSAKSWSIATILVMMATESKQRVLCCREYQNSIDDSVHHLLSDTISRLKLDNYFEVQRDTILGRNGSQFIFTGLKMNARSVKSLENLTACWVEEAEAVSQDSWSLLLPTVRAKSSTFFVSFNRDTSDDPCWRMFGEKTPPGAIVRKVLWSDNPWLPAVLRDEIEWTRATDVEAFDHVWNGEPLHHSDAQIFRNKYVIRSFDTPKDSTFYIGCDWGFANSPDALIRCYIENDPDGLPCLFVDAEVYAHSVSIEDTPALFNSILPHRQWPVRADSARPEMIDWMVQRGYSVTAAKKGPGSVETGIRYLKSFKELVVHPRCQHLQTELRLYSYKIDSRTNDILPIILDKHNDLLDALRYATEPIWSEPDRVLHFSGIGAGDLGI
jgi:phage terminase large subunit